MIKYKDWVVSKPFELRGPLAKYFVPTQDSDIPGGSSNQAGTVKSKVIEKIRSQDSAFVYSRIRFNDYRKHACQ
nr:MAG TPA: hypothetical protein [Caudoviricetes sp.]